MRIGVTLPSMGHLAQPANLVQAAEEAERLGYDALWVGDRLLYPVNPRTKYPVTPDGSLPDLYKRVLDPIEALTYVAAPTSRIGLGTSVLDIPFHNPVIVARRLSSLDILSNGRLRAGFGLGLVGRRIRSRGRGSEGPRRTGR